MDAKPQRARIFMPLRDENLPPANIGPLKQIHHRNKSTPALTSLVKPSVSINAALPKRSAFADVSNTIRNAPSTKYDLAPGLKTIEEKVVFREVGKPTNTGASALPLHKFKSTTHLRPAQRPLSTLTTKSTAVVPVQTIAKPSIAAPESEAPPFSNSFVTDTKYEPCLVKPAVKRQAVVLKEPETTLADIVSINPVQTSVPVELPSQPSTRLETATTLPIASTTITKQLPDLPQLPARENHQAIVSNDLVPVSALAPILPSVLTSYFSAPSAQPLVPTTVQPTALAPAPTIEQPKPELLPLNDMVGRSEYAPLSQAEVYPPQVVRQMDDKVALPAPEEYWDEDEDEEYYDAEGYTTARSFRSRGDNTTNQTSFLLEPRVNAQVDLELEQAAKFVDRTRLDQDFEEECWDMSMVAEYSDEIFAYMRGLEERYRPNPYYMDQQGDIQWSMRSVLVDWMTQVHARFGLLPETLFLAVNYVDRFLSVKVVSIGKLQLVGACALFIAAKYEEISCPSVSEIVYMVDKGYTTEEILKAERFMLSMLKFECGWPGPMSFLRRISKADDYDLETRTLAKYFLEVTLMDERFVASVPSFTAAASHCLARLMLKKGGWTHAHVYYSQYTYWQLQSVMTVIIKCCQNPQKHHGAVYEKYIDKRYKRAALFVEGEVRKGFEVPWIDQKTGMIDHLSLLRWT